VGEKKKEKMLGKGRHKKEGGRKGKGGRGREKKEIGFFQRAFLINLTALKKGGKEGKSVDVSVGREERKERGGKPYLTS